MKISKPDTRRVRSTISAIERLDRQLHDIITEEEAQKRELAGRFHALTEEQTEDLLKAMEVEAVNREKLGIRTAALRSAGVTTVWQLRCMSPQALCGIRGIGRETAEKIKEITEAIAKEARETLRVRLSVDSKTPAGTALVQTLYEFFNTREPRERCEAFYQAHHEDAAVALQAAKPAGAALRWLFAPGKRKAQAAEAAQTLFALESGDFAKTALSLIEDYGKRKHPPEEAAWEDFQKRASLYYAALESFDFWQNRGGELKNGLPAQLVREVEEEPLHTEGLKSALRGYQRFGTKYILHQRRVLLGDEMGLGKTVQAIAAMVSLAAEGATHFLVVCPASVLVNWAREIAAFSGLQAILLRGADQPALEGWLERGGVAVTNYESLIKYALPPDFFFSLLVVDEAHYVKNPDARRTRAVSALLPFTGRALFMTGTPLENRVDEMCFLIRLLQPELAAELEQVKYLSAAPRFRELLAPVYLRRTRDDVLTELPELIENEEWCTPSREEEALYAEAVQSGNFMSMRQVSWLGGPNPQSSKAKRLLELCDMAWTEGRKIIVFSYFRETLRTVCALLGASCLPPITGATPPQRRQEIIDAFASAPGGTALPCQVQAGGMGLNIQTASVVIFCEPQLKPSMESQAVSRAYRMGQVRNVLACRLLCENTVDERIYELLKRKQILFDEFADDSIAGDAYLKMEKSVAGSIIEQERQRLKLPSDSRSEIEPAQDLLEIT